MLTPEKASRILRKHFDEVTPEKFLENIERFGSESEPGDSREAPSEKQEKTSMGQLMLFPQPRAPSASIHLDAYLACALTGLSNEQRELMFQLSDVVATICQEYDISVYEPRKKTDPVYNPDVADTDVFRTDRERVLTSDLMILLTHYAGFGAGEELDFAFNALLPVIVIAHSDHRVSRMVTGVPSFKLVISYSEPQELREQLHQKLAQVRPILTERKLAFSAYNVNLVGEKIRLLREGLGLTREEVADKVQLLTVAALRQIEESPDRLSNPSLIHLRQIAAILKTTVADLVEPDLNERVISSIQEWLGESGRKAGRFGSMTQRDRNRLLRRLLLRMIDSLEDEDQD